MSCDLVHDECAVKTEDYQVRSSDEQVPWVSPLRCCTASGVLTCDGIPFFLLQVVDYHKSLGRRLDVHSLSRLQADK